MMNKFLALETNARKNLSLLVMFGGAVVFTVIACVCLYFLTGNPLYMLYMGVLAHAQIFTIITGFVAMLVKRRLSLNKEGVSMEDSGVEEPTK